jgi:hypothetical protein
MLSNQNIVFDIGTQFTKRCDSRFLFGWFLLYLTTLSQLHSLYSVEWYVNVNEELGKMERSVCALLYKSIPAFLWSARRKSRRSQCAQPFYEQIYEPWTFRLWSRVVTIRPQRSELRIERFRVRFSKDGYPGVIRAVPQSLCVNARTDLKIAHNSLLPRPFHFIIHRKM